MLLELSTRRTDSAVAASSSGRNTTDLLRTSAVVNRGRKVAPGHEQSQALAMALGQLPSGTCLIVRDMSGREWCIKPHCQAMVIELSRAGCCHIWSRASCALPA